MFLRANIKNISKYQLLNIQNLLGCPTPDFIHKCWNNKKKFASDKHSSLFLYFKNKFLITAIEGNGCYSKPLLTFLYYCSI